MAEVSEKYIDYPSKVLSGEIPACNYVKLACKRFFSFLEREDMYFDEKAVDKVVNFIAKLKHVTGEHSGKPFVLSPWQFNIVCNIFGFKWKKNNTRVCRTAFIQVGRKNGKSALLAAISAYCLIADGEQNAQVVFSANSAKQAGLCFKMTNDFLQVVDPNGKIFKRYRDKIKFDYTKSEIIVTAADASKLDGLNCSMFCQDELEEARDGKLWDVLATSQGMRSNPLAIAICTAGFNLNSFCFQMRQSNIDVLMGKKEDDTTFSAIYELDAEDDFEDPTVWVKANPNLDVTIKSDYLQQQINRAKNNPMLMASVQTKLFNMWLSSAEEWLPQKHIMAAQKKWDFKDFQEPFAYVGLDLAATSDMTAVSVMIPYDDVFYFRNYYFIPSECLKTSVNKDFYNVWKRQGNLIVTDGNVTDYGVVTNEIIKINEQVPIVQIAYDAWNSVRIVTSLTNYGFSLTPYSQSIGSMNRPTKELARLILSGKVVMYENPIDRWMFSNVTIKRDYNGNERPTKDRKDEKVDGVFAMLNALGNYMQQNNMSNEVDVITF